MGLLLPGAAAPGVAAAYDPNAAAAMYGRGSGPGNNYYCYIDWSLGNSKFCFP